MKKIIKNKTVYEELMYIDDLLVERILNIIFIAKDEDRHKYYIKYNDISLMNLMFRFINNYEGTDINKDLWRVFDSYEKDYSLEFYVYFIFCYFKIYNGNFLFNPLFVDNISNLIYATDIESFFNPDKFKLHYQSVYTDTLSLKEDVSDSLKNYIRENLPNNLDNDMDRAIAIYILLAIKLRYSPIYTLTEEFYDTQPYFDVTIENNEVVCIQFSIIYHKLLKEYGIDANLAGDINSHMYVNLNFGTVSFRADATRYGFYSEQLELSDMTSLKYGFMVEGLYIPDKTYTDVKYVEYVKRRIHDSILKVYQSLGLRTDLKNIFDSYIDNFQRAHLSPTGSVDKKEFDERIAILNSHFRFVEDNVENTQFYNYLLYSFFYDIADERMESISLYRKSDKGIELSKLLVLYDQECKPFYYLYTNGKLINYDVNEVVEILLNDGWCFKELVNIDALYLDDEETVKKLMR